MSVAAVQITDAEFTQLIGANMLAFAARHRAETVAYDLKRRIAAVANDLRHWAAAGQLSDPRSASRIANTFESLANEVDHEVDRNRPARSTDGSLTERDLSNYLDCSITECELEAWHHQDNDVPGTGTEGR